MKLNLSLQLLKSISCPLLIKVHSSLDFPWLLQKLDAARNGASHWCGIILSQIQETLNQETEASGNVYDSEVNPREGKASMLLTSSCLLFLAIIHSLGHLLDFGILDSRDTVLCWAWLQDRKKKVYLRHFTCEQRNIGMLCIIGTPGHSTEFISQELQGIHLKNKRELLR